MTEIGVACDHAGYDLKCYIIDHLTNLNYHIIDFGCFTNVSCDYADYAHLLGYAIDNDEIQVCIVFCGSGNGINMTVNKHSSVRSALCWNSEIAFLARHHNDANVCSIPSRFISNDEAINIVNVFLKECFDGGRHKKRIEKIPL